MKVILGCDLRILLGIPQAQKLTEAFKCNTNLKSEGFSPCLGGSAWQSERFVISRSRVQIPPGAVFIPLEYLSFLMLIPLKQ